MNYKLIELFSTACSFGVCFFDQEIENIMNTEYKAAEKLIAENLDKLKTLAEALLKREELTSDEVKKLLG